MRDTTTRSSVPSAPPCTSRSFTPCNQPSLEGHAISAKTLFLVPSAPPHRHLDTKMLNAQVVRVSHFSVAGGTLPSVSHVCRVEASQCVSNVFCHSSHNHRHRHCCTATNAAAPPTHSLPTAVGTGRAPVILILLQTSQFRSFGKCVNTLCFPDPTLGKSSGWRGTRESAASLPEAEASPSNKFSANCSSHLRVSRKRSTRDKLSPPCASKSRNKFLCATLRSC